MEREEDRKKDKKTKINRLKANLGQNGYRKIETNRVKMLLQKDTNQKRERERVKESESK
jgi:hypothetical protein